MKVVVHKKIKVERSNYTQELDEHHRDHDLWEPKAFCSKMSMKVVICSG
jgi:hypothetical protein